MTLTSKPFNKTSSSVGRIVDWFATIRALMWSFVFIYFLFTVCLFFNLYVGLCLIFEI